MPSPPRGIYIWGAIQKESLKIYLTDTKNQAKRLRATTFAIAYVVGIAIINWKQLRKVQ